MSDLSKLPQPSLISANASAPPHATTLPPLPRAQAAWSERVVDAEVVRQIVCTCGIAEPVARVLVGRGVNSVAAARAYLSPLLKDLPDPLRLAGMDAAVERLVAAVQRGELVGVFGDYDVDGVTSTTLLSEFLDQVGARNAQTIPDRLIEGYGLSRGGVDRLKAAGATLIVTVDCGVTAHEEIDYARKLDLDVVVIDHHTVPVTLPAAVAVINPHRDDCMRGSEMLCAVGVTFNLVAAVRRALQMRGWFSATRVIPDLKSALDLVALGTVADVVPLVGENRILVAAGLKLLQRRARVGLAALLNVANMSTDDVDAGTLGFQLGPRVNAAGRLGDAMQAVRLLRSGSAAEAQTLAVALDRENAARKDLERSIVAQAIAQVEQSALLRDAPVTIVHNDSWHPGVVGIVASRLVDRFGRPAIVIGEGGRGSGRSVEKFHLHEALTAVKDTLAGFGGHAHAAGVRTKPGGVELFRDALLQHAHNVLAPGDLQKVLFHDGALEVADVDTQLCNALKVAAPFGRKNPEPTFLFSDVNITHVRELGGGHVKAVAESRRAAGHAVEIIAFGAADRLPAFCAGAQLLGTPELNTWRGSTTPQLRIKDIR